VLNNQITKNSELTIKANKTMITVEEAEKIILKTAKNQKNTEGVVLLKAMGKILAEDIIADRDFPPFDRVTMDGIALNYASFEAGQRRFLIENTQAAGQKQIKLKNKNNCIEIMTGAMMPKDCNTVVRYEDLKIENNFAEIQIETIDYQQNTHKKGSDRKRRDVLIPKGTCLTAAEIGTAATVGQAIVKVVTVPKVAIISTGNELVEITEFPEDHQIRRSNVYAIAALLIEKCKITPHLFHFNDDEAEITEGIKTILKKHDLVIFSGAVSEGKFDFVPKALELNQVKCLFHKISQRPGKPLWFGQHRSGGAVVFGLPGNPVSTFMCACRYVLPWIKTYLLQKNTESAFAMLTEDVTFTPNLTYFLQVKIENINGVLMAKPVSGGGSGDLANLNDADGFLELPIDKSIFLKGEVFKYINFR
jgi:molybdopterin molybdotransferase